MEQNPIPFVRRRRKENPTQSVLPKPMSLPLADFYPVPSLARSLDRLRRRVLNYSRISRPSKCHPFVALLPSLTTALDLVRNLPSHLLTLRGCNKKRTQQSPFLLDLPPAAFLYNHRLIVTRSLHARHLLRPPSVISRCLLQLNLLE